MSCLTICKMVTHLGIIDGIPKVFGSIFTIEKFAADRVIFVSAVIHHAISLIHCWPAIRCSSASARQGLATCGRPLRLTSSWTANGWQLSRPRCLANIPMKFSPMFSVYPAARSANCMMTMSSPDRDLAKTYGGTAKLLHWCMTDKWSELATSLARRDLCFFLGPRPGKKSMTALSSLGITHCCSLLSAREDVQPIRKICEKLGCRWIWLPIDGGRLEVLRHMDLAGYVETLLDDIENEPEPRIYFHCSAGIHRTGFFVYALLRLCGFCRSRAIAELRKLRAVTAEQVGQDRLDLADELLLL